MLLWYFSTKKPTRKRAIGILILSLISASCIFAIVSPSKFHKLFKNTPPNKSSNLGPNSDLAASNSVFIIEVIPNQDDHGEPLPLRAEDMRSMQDQLRARLNSYGNISAEITSVGENRIEIHFPHMKLDQAKEIITKLSTTTQLTIHSVHPLHNSDPEQAHKLAKLVAEKREVVPQYRAYKQHKKDATGKYIRDKNGDFIVDKYWLVKRRASVKGTEIAYAGASITQPGTTEVELTDKGAEQMIHFTSNMKRGEYIVTVINNTVVSAASLNAKTLGKHFVITGANSKAESEKLAEALNYPLQNEIRIIQKTSEK